MSVSSRGERGDGSLEGLEGRLRALRAVEPPALLRARLLAGVPDAAAARARSRGPRAWHKAAGWIGVAAAVIAVASAVVWLGGPSGRPVIDVNSDARGVFATDHNGLHPPDVNVRDTNSLY